MKSYILFTFLIFVLADVVRSNKLPSIFKPCHRNDPNLNECVLKSAQNGIKQFSKGIPELGIPVSDPLLLKKINPMTGGTLNLSITDCYVYKTSNAKFKSFNVDLKNKKLVGILVGNLEFAGKYEIDGRLLVLPITGKGDIKAVVKNADIRCALEYKLIQKNGVDYIKLTKTSMATTNVENVSFKLTNLFNGNKLLGENTNKVLNESWKDVYDELAAPVFFEGSKSIHKILQKLFEDIPFDEVLLPN